MNDPALSSPALPTDAQSILALAARSLFDVFAHASEGMLCPTTLRSCSQRLRDQN